MGGSVEICDGIVLSGWLAWRIKRVSRLVGLESSGESCGGSAAFNALISVGVAE